jgi:hypothetical protein
MRYLFWAALVVASFAATGCETKTCTEIGCGNHLSLTVSRADGSFPSGVHQVDVTADGVTRSCTFTFAGSVVNPACPSGSFVSVNQATTCTETRTGNSVSLRCDPIPGQFVESVSVFGTPRELRIVQSVDGVVLLDQSLSPTYKLARPNGPDCEPVCQQASVALTLQ